MTKPCADVPAQLWLSDFLGARPAGNKVGKAKMPWTPQLEAMCHRMHEDGDGWQDIAGALETETGIKLVPRAVEDYCLRAWGNR